jgi:segregation and condensation protein A
MTHTVITDQFEGPLGVLLQLAEKGNIEITRISLAQITTTYLDHVHSLQNQTPEQLSEFLVLGARLLHIKSLALLPGSNEAEQTLELQRLNDELAEYRAFQNLAQQLAARKPYQTWERTIIEQLGPNELPFPSITLDQLTGALDAALERLQPPPQPLVMPNHISLETKIAQLRGKLPSGVNLNDAFRACSDQLEVIVTFLAALELVRQGHGRLAQPAPFAALQLEAAGG